MDRPLENNRASAARTTPKDFFLWAGAMVALYWSVIAFILLVFNYINYSFPNPLSYLAPNPYDSGIGYEMASIVVLFPAYAILMWLIRRDIAQDPSRKEVWVRRWALIFTLFVAGATIAGDLIALLTAFFSGEELTSAFLLKALVLFLVAAVAFMHFIADFWGYWEQNASRRAMVCWSVGALAALSVLAGFALFGTPSSARQYRFDEQRVNDLQNIQSQVTYYYQAKQKLPPTLTALSDPISGFQAPTDPQTGAPYEYQTTGALSFELCATFSAQSWGSYGYASVPVPAGLGSSGRGFDNWAHGVGRACFERTIDPQLYPPLNPKSVQ